LETLLSMGGGVFPAAVPKRRGLLFGEEGAALLDLPGDVAGLGPLGEDD
jgi:hypothetical protein